MERPVLAAWAAVALLSVGGVVGAVSVESTSGAASVTGGRPDPALETTMTTASGSTPTTGRTTTRAPAATPAGWTLVQGEGWRISLPAKPKVRSEKAPPSMPYKAWTSYMNPGPDNGTFLGVYHYEEKPPLGSMATVMIGAVHEIGVVSEGAGAMSPIGSADIGGRFGQTLTVPLRTGSVHVTSFVSGNDLFVLVNSTTPLHARILATFGS